MVRMCHATCRSALEKAVQDGLIRVNPALGCKLPPKKAREMQVLTREELQRFLIQAKFEGYYEVFLLDLATGLRRGELMALQWDDLNFKTGVLNVNKQVYDVRGQLQISTPKTKNSVRKIVLPPAVVEVLREYKKTVDSRWMFPSPVKEDCPITPGVVRRRLQLILEHAGCKHVRFHDLRHPYVKYTTKIFSLRLMDFQAQAYNSFERLPPPMPISISSIVCSGSFLFLEKSFPGAFTHASKFAAVFFIAWNNADRTRSGYDFLFTWKASLKNVIIFKAKPSIFIDLSSVF